MTKLSFLKPFDQPTGKLRLLDELRRNLKDSAFEEFWIMVAYAKAGPLLRLEEDVKAWKARGGKTHAVIGIDQLGTSREALDFALRYFDSVRVAHAPADGNGLHPTFHPKLYVFVGKRKAICYIGSNNLTVGGTETNFEASTILELDLPSEQKTLDELLECWTVAPTASVLLTQKILDDMGARGQVVGEEEQRSMRKAATKKVFPGAKNVAEPPAIFQVFPVKPPSPLPKSAIKPAVRKAKPAPSAAKTPVAGAAAAEALAIQIVPHHNGEVFLSKIAVDQNPAFFGWPFTGKTTPKKRGNQPYPQRTPDPIVNVEVFDKTGKRVLRVEDYGVNTVYYSEKSEIRITFRPDIVVASPAGSVLLMQDAPAGSNYDYDMSIYAPGSAEYAKYLAVCNQEMPSGGSSNPRRFGWL